MYKALSSVRVEECYPELLRSSLQILLDAKNLLPEGDKDFKYCAEIPTCVGMVTHALVSTYVGKTKFCLTFSYLRQELMYFWVDMEASIQAEPIICPRVSDAILLIITEIERQITCMHLENLQVWAAEVAWAA